MEQMDDTELKFLLQHDKIPNIISYNNYIFLN